MAYKGMRFINSTVRKCSTGTKASCYPPANQLLVQNSMIDHGTDFKPTSKCRPTVLPCPPPHPGCPPIDKPHTRLLLQGLWFLAKLGLFVGVTKMTIDEGLWGSSEETADLARRMWMPFQSEEDELKSKTENNQVCF